MSLIYLAIRAINIATLIIGIMGCHGKFRGKKYETHLVVSLILINLILLGYEISSSILN